LAKRATSRSSSRSYRKDDKTITSTDRHRDPKAMKRRQLEDALLIKQKQLWESRHINQQRNVKDQISDKENAGQTEPKVMKKSSALRQPPGLIE
jgi:hypothetical protein